MMHIKDHQLQILPFAPAHLDGVERLEQKVDTSNHHAVKRLIGNKQVGAATDDDQGQAFGIGFLHGFDESHARGRLDEMGDGAAHAHGGDVCKACHGLLS